MLPNDKLTLIFSAFNDEARRLDTLIQEGNCYQISDCIIETLTTSRSKYTSIDHDFALKSESWSTIEPARPFVPRFRVPFTNLEELSTNRECEFFNTLVVITDSEDPYYHRTRRTGRLCLRQNVKLIDTTGCTIWLVLWDNFVNQLIPHIVREPVVFIKGAKVFRDKRESGQISLHAWFSTKIDCDPKLEEAQILKDWWNLERVRMRGLTGDAASASLQLYGRNSEQCHPPLVTRTFCGIEDEVALQPPYNQRNVYFYTSSIITAVKDCKMFYKGCPNMKCRRKVEERVVSGGTTVYYCPNCSNSYRRFEIGVYIRLFMRDFSGGRWVTVFNAQVEELYLTTPLGLKHLFESSDTNKFRVFINKITFKPFTWLLKAERDLYNGLWKTRFIVSSFNNTIDLLSTGAGLLQEISELESGH